MAILTHQNADYFSEYLLWEVTGHQLIAVGLLLYEPFLGVTDDHRDGDGS